MTHDTNVTYGETVAAITAAFYENPAMYDKIYEAAGIRLNGFTGIWRYIAVIAKDFEIEYQENFKLADIDWIGAIDHYAQRAMKGLLEEELITTVETARECLECHCY